MNEQIKELWNKTCGKIQPEMDGICMTNQRGQKFAELIVAECGVALNPMLRDMISRGQAYDLIKQHFGVEE